MQTILYVCVCVTIDIMLDINNYVANYVDATVNIKCEQALKVHSTVLILGNTPTNSLLPLKASNSGFTFENKGGLK